MTFPRLTPLLLALTIAGCGVESFPHRSTRHVDVHSLGSARTVDIKVPLGAVVAEETSGDEVLVAYDVNLAAQDEATLKAISARGELLAERVGDALEVRTAGLSRDERRRGRINYTVYLKVPEGTKVVAHCPVGNITATGLADAELETGTGQIKLEGGSGAARLVNQTGRIRVKDHRGTVHGSTTTGPIIASFADVSGEGELSLTTAVGSITVTLPEETPANFTLDVGTGSIDLPTALKDQNDTEVKGLVQKSWSGTLAGGGRPITLRAKTGNIVIQLN